MISPNLSIYHEQSLVISFPKFIEYKSRKLTFYLSICEAISRSGAAFVILYIGEVVFNGPRIEASPTTHAGGWDLSVNCVVRLLWAKPYKIRFPIRIVYLIIHAVQPSLMFEFCIELDFRRFSSLAKSRPILVLKLLVVLFWMFWSSAAGEESGLPQQLKLLSSPGW